MRSAVPLLAAMLACIGCSCSKSSDPATTPIVPDASGPPADYTFGRDRPLNVLRVPEGYDAAKPAPLVIVLHGYGANGAAQSVLFNLGSIADREGFFLIAPDGTRDSSDRQFWNATDTCCDFEKKGVDDVKYLTGLVDELAGFYNIDPKRVFLVGHSNGGAMSFRLACDAADRFAAIVDLAGPYFSNPVLCKPTSPVALLHLHGTNDDTVPYDGGPALNGAGRFGGALDAVTAWAAHDRCGAAADTTAAAMDIDGDVAGAETKASRYTGCAAGTAVELWTMQGSGHVPLNLTKKLPDLIYGFLSSHAKR
jgi:polyhydroxybutyrate depolymerase